MKTRPHQRVLPEIKGLAVIFAAVCLILFVGVLIGRQSGRLEVPLLAFAADAPREATLLTAVEMVLLIGLVSTLLAGWTAFISLRALVGERRIERTRRRLRREIERQRNTSDELHITHQQLATTSGQLGGILEGTTDLIAAVDTSLRYISFNESYRRNILELYKKEIFTGMKVEEALELHPSKRDEYLDFWRRALGGEKYTAGQEFTDESGNTLFYELTCTPIIDSEQKVIGAALVSRDVTERKRTEERLKQEMDFVSAAIDVNSSLVIVLDLDGRIIRFNHACEKLSGYSFDEVRGRVFWNVLIPTEDISAIKASYRDFESTFFKDSYVHHWITKDEELKLISWQVSAIKDENGHIRFVVGTGIDITEKREFETARNRMLRILEMSPDLISIYDFQGRITYLNPAGRKMIGLNEQTDVSRVRNTSYHPQWVNDLLQSEAVPVAIKEGAWIGTTAILTRDGEEIPTSQLLLAHQDRKGKIEYFSTVIRDISSQKKLEENLAEARDRALEAIRNKSEFLANMSHEIRTPMSGVIGISELLLGTDLDDEQRDYAATIQKCGESLLTIINDILDFSKLEAGKLQLENSAFDLNETLDSVIELFTQPVYKKGIELSVLINHDVPNRLLGDSGRLRQVLTNLVSNAVKFTDQGEIVVRVKVVENGDRPVIGFSVSDTGTGISAAAKETLFLPYSQAGARNPREQEGTGLGLAICKQIAEMMGGELGFESKPGLGSTFWFNAPFDAQPDTGNIEDAEALKGRRILIIDDNDTSRRILVQQSKSWGMVAEEASSGEAGLALLRSAARGGEHFEALVLDLKMPGMSGLEMAEEIASDPVLRRTKIIIAASAAHRSRLKRNRNPNVDSFISKPVRLTEFLETLSSTFTGLAEVTGHAARQKEQRSSAQPGSGDGSEAESNVAGLQVLVAEDNVVNRKVISAQLRNLGHTAVVVGNGREAVDAFLAGGCDLILMDCEMPEMNGLEATRRIREFESEGRRIPIIAVTAHVLPGERDKCLAAGMDDYLSKPTRENELSGMIERWSSGRKMQEVADREKESSSGKEDPAASEKELIRRRLEELSEACGADVIAECIGFFTADTAGTVENLFRAIRSGDFGRAETEAHKLKGSTANMGAAGLSAKCEELIAAARADDAGRSRLHMEQFVDRFQVLEPVYLEHREALLESQHAADHRG